MVAVGTRISPRPPHRSRRALLTHRAPPSGQTSARTRFETGCAPAHSRQSDRRGIRTTAACRLFPSGEALPSTTSAGSCLPLFDRFLGTTASSDFSSTYMLGVRLVCESAPKRDPFSSLGKHLIPARKFVRGGVRVGADRDP